MLGLWNLTAADLAPVLSDAGCIHIEYSADRVIRSRSRRTTRSLFPLPPPESSRALLYPVLPLIALSPSSALSTPFRPLLVFPDCSPGFFPVFPKERSLSLRLSRPLSSLCTIKCPRALISVGEHCKFLLIPVRHAVIALN